MTNLTVQTETSVIKFIDPEGSYIRTVETVADLNKSLAKSVNSVIEMVQKLEGYGLGRLTIDLANYVSLYRTGAFSAEGETTNSSPDLRQIVNYANTACENEGYNPESDSDRRQGMDEMPMAAAKAADLIGHGYFQIRWFAKSHSGYSLPDNFHSLPVHTGVSDEEAKRVSDHNENAVTARQGEKGCFQAPAHRLGLVAQVEKKPSADITRLSLVGDECFSAYGDEILQHWRYASMKRIKQCHEIFIAEQKPGTLGRAKFDPEGGFVAAPKPDNKGNGVGTGDGLTNGQLAETIEAAAANGDATPLPSSEAVGDIFGVATAIIANTTFGEYSLEMRNELFEHFDAVLRCLAADNDTAEKPFNAGLAMWRAAGAEQVPDKPITHAIG